jgi:hypothetical protein
MFLASLPLQDPPQNAIGPRRRGRVVWQPRYEGIALIAYQGGRAVAGVSGPWSDRYVLTWWDQPEVANPIELFETIEAACAAVERRLGTTNRRAVPQYRARAPARTVAWWRAWWPWRRRDGEIDQLRRQCLGRGTDLAGLHFSASS